MFKLENKFENFPHCDSKIRIKIKITQKLDEEEKFQFDFLLNCSEVFKASPNLKTQTKLKKICERSSLAQLLRYPSHSICLFNLKKKIEIIQKLKCEKFSILLKFEVYVRVFMSPTQKTVISYMDAI